MLGCGHRSILVSAGLVCGDLGGFVDGVGLLFGEMTEELHACACECRIVEQLRDAKLGVKVLQLLLRGGEEQLGGPRDASAEDDDLRGEFGYGAIEGESQVAAELVEGLGCGGVSVCRGGELRNFALYAGVSLIGALDGAGGDGIFEDSAIVGEIPNLSAGRNAGAAGDEMAIDGEC